MVFNRRLPQVFFFVVPLLVSLPVLSAGFGDPRGFLGSETVTETPLYPGVIWYQVNGTQLGAPQVTHVVTVDIGEPHLTMRALPGERFVNERTGQFFRRSFVSQMQSDNDSLVAINTSFFDIGSTMAPLGLLMRNKVMLREPESGGPSFVFTDRGVPAIAHYGSSRTIRYGLMSRDFAGINRNALGPNQVAVYQQPWDRSPGTSAAFTNGYEITELVLEKTGFFPSSGPGTPAQMRGRVIEVRQNQPSVPIAADQFVITAAGTGRVFFQTVTIGSTLMVEWSLTGGLAGIDWNRIAHGTAGGACSSLTGNDRARTTPTGTPLTPEVRSVSMRTHQNFC